MAKRTTTTITRLGHASVLIETPNYTILTDPVLFDRIGLSLRGFPTIGPKRITKPALSIEELPHVDIILISHAHMDHLDVKTLRALSHRQPYKITIVTAMNTVRWVEKYQRKKIYELDRNQSLELEHLTIHAGETRHRGARYPRNPDRSQESVIGAGHNAYLLEYKQDKKDTYIVFGGDTAYTHAFKARSKYIVDVALMPIGAYDPFRFQHCTPEEAIDMALDMNTKVFIPIHRNTFRLSKEKIHEPIERLQEAIKLYPHLRLGCDHIGGEYVI